jgi:hypothetical protein
LRKITSTANQKESLKTGVHLYTPGKLGVHLYTPGKLKRKLKKH